MENKTQMYSSIKMNGISLFAPKKDRDERWLINFVNGNYIAAEIQTLQ